MFAELFTSDMLRKLLPPERSDQFFEALYGDASEGAYDISLAYAGHDLATNRLRFELQLRERPGRCLACNLTYGLPDVFSRHPLINLSGVVDAINSLLAGRARCSSWRLGNTKSLSKNLHAIPLEISLS